MVPAYLLNVSFIHEDVSGVITHMAKPRTVPLPTKERVATLREVTIRDLRYMPLIPSFKGTIHTMNNFVLTMAPIIQGQRSYCHTLG